MWNAMAEWTYGAPAFLLGYAVLIAAYMTGLHRAHASLRHYPVLWLVVLVPLYLSTLAVALVRPLLEPVGVVPHGAFEFFLKLGLFGVTGYFSAFVISYFVPWFDNPKLVRGTELVWGIGEYGHPWRRRQYGSKTIVIGGIPFSREDERQHFKIVGTTGTGKTTAIRKILDAALARGDRAIIADPGEDFLKRYYRPERGDTILNPFDGRSVRWTPFLEIEKASDVEMVGHALIPRLSAESESEWRGYARTFLNALLRQLWDLDRESPGQAKVEKLFELVTVTDIKQLRKYLAGTPADGLVKGENERMFGSLRAVATTAVNGFQHIAEQRQGEPFSVRQWVREGEGVLFIPYAPNQIPALKSLISGWMSLAIQEAQVGQENVDRRLWFIVDELDAVGPIDQLKDALARLRKFGGRCVLAFQSIADVVRNYGNGEHRTIMENCGNSLILRCSGSEAGGTAEFASKLIGEREVIKTSHSRSEGDKGRSETDSHRTEMTVMASEIEQMPKLSVFLKAASETPWHAVRLDGEQYQSFSPLAAFPWKFAAATAVVGSIIAGIGDHGPDTLARRADAERKMAEDQARAAYLKTLSPAEAHRVEMERLSKLQKTQRATQAARVQSFAPKTLLPQAKPDMRLAMNQAVAVGADEFSLLCYGLRGTPLTDDEWDRLVSAMSYDYRILQNPLRKQEMLQKLKAKYEARMQAFKGRYFVLDKKVFLGNYDLESQSFPLRPDAAQSLPWSLEGHWGCMGGVPADLVVTNMGEFENYYVEDRATVNRLADMSVSQRSGHAKVYLFAQDVSADAKALTAEIWRVQLFDYSGRLIGDFGLKESPEEVRTASIH